MQVIQVRADAPDADVIDRAAKILRDGGLVAFPTETVYGLGANALDPDAVERIYAAKGRPEYNPLIVHVASREGARAVVSAWPRRAELLARAFWPGPLTMVLPKRGTVPDNVTAGLPSVAVRVPSHPVALALIATAGVPLAAPSANRSTMVSPTTAQHVAASLDGAVDLILDGGPTTVGIESTVVDLTRAQARVLRPGMISTPDIEAVIGSLDADGVATNDEAPRPSPGMLDKHYSPRARVVLVATADVDVAVKEERARGHRVDVLALTPRDADGYAARLYDRLHAMDDAGVEVVIVERVPDSAEWAGIRDRLERAARE